MGGFKGVVYTDFLLFFVAMAGSIGAAYYLVNIPEIGGVQALIIHPNVADKISMLPDFSNTEQLIMLLIIPLAVQWEVLRELYILIFFSSLWLWQALLVRLII
jgi:hypothetical protein